MVDRTRTLVGLLCAVAIPLGVLATPAQPEQLSAAQIVQKHIAARGGLQAWHAVQTLSLSGSMEAGLADSAARSQLYVRNSWKASHAQQQRDLLASSKAQSAGDTSGAQQVALPFRLEMKRPNKSRLEIDFAGTTAVQVYDGALGWKVRPFLNRSDVEPFTSDEARQQAKTDGLDGPLLGSASSGTQVSLEGTDNVDGRPAYRLKLSTKAGDTRHVWIDTQSFLDVKVEGSPHRMDGRIRNVYVYQRDFRTVQGVKVPFSYETVVDGGFQTHTMRVQTADVNRALDDKRFAKPEATTLKVAAQTKPVKGVH